MTNFLDEIQFYHAEDEKWTWRDWTNFIGLAVIIGIGLGIFLTTIIANLFIKI